MELRTLSFLLLLFSIDCPPTFARLNTWKQRWPSMYEQVIVIVVSRFVHTLAICIKHQTRHIYWCYPLPDKPRRKLPQVIPYADKVFVALPKCSFPGTSTDIACPQFFKRLERRQHLCIACTPTAQDIEQKNYGTDNGSHTAHTLNHIENPFFIIL